MSEAMVPMVAESSGAMVCPGVKADERDFEEFVASRSSRLWRSAFLLTGDRHRAEHLLQTEQQTAVALGCSVGTVKSQGARAFKALRASPALAEAGGREFVADRGDLAPGELRLLLSDLSQRRTDSALVDGGCVDSGPTRIVVAVDLWGDRRSWTDANCTGEFSGQGGYWLPGLRGGGSHRRGARRPDPRVVIGRSLPVRYRLVAG